VKALALVFVLYTLGVLTVLGSLVWLLEAV
jgi:hypothetical protein